MAVTRARKNLWIVESGPDSAQHLVALWTSPDNHGGEPLVSVVHANDPEVNSIYIFFFLDSIPVFDPRTWREEILFISTRIVCGHCPLTWLAILKAMAVARRIIKPGKSTNPEAWRTQGELLLHRGLYQDVSYKILYTARL